MDNDKIVDILKRLGNEEVPAEVQSIVEKQAEQFSKGIEQSRHIILREYIMRNKMTKIAVAAVIILGVMLVLHHSGGSLDGTSIAWGEIAGKIEKVKAFAYQIKIKMQGMSNMSEGEIVNDMYVQVSSEYGMHIDAYMGDIPAHETYILYSEEAIISVIHEQKKYVRMRLTDALLEKMKKDNGDPKTMVEDYTKYEYTKIGRDVINGIEVEGIESTDPRITGGIFDKVIGRLWVDVERQLPVRLEAKYSSDDGKIMMEMVIENFEWDLELEASVFVPEIPGDYEMMANIQLPRMDEEGAVEGLAFFAELSGGKYPGTLNIMAAMQEGEKVFRNYLTNHHELIVNDQLEPEILQKFMTLQGTCMFYMQLVQDANEPAYYGDRVTAEFGHAVLLRWKTSEDTYKVIFGDLRSEDVNGMRLAELEAQPLNLKPQAIKPQPANGAVVGRSTDFSWMGGVDAVSHRVYFGNEANSMSLLAEVTEENYTGLSQLELDNKYYWCVNEVNANGLVAVGEVWSFSTGSLGWWKLDGSAADSSGNGHDGTLPGDVKWSEGFLELDGKDFVTIGTDEAFDIQYAITVSAWIKVNKFDKAHQAIITKGDSAWRLQRNAESDTIEFACTGVRVPGTNWGNVLGNVNINDGKWHHIAGVYDGLRMSLYVDGQLDVSSTAAGTINKNGMPVLIGGNSQQSGREWNGWISDVQIYNYGMTTEEVAGLYEESSAIEE